MRGVKYDLDSFVSGEGVKIFEMKNFISIPYYFEGSRHLQEMGKYRRYRYKTIN
jgi:hypothetical protein